MTRRDRQSDSDVAVKEALARRCQVCGAPPGRLCTTVTGLPAWGLHRDRYLSGNP